MIVKMRKIGLSGLVLIAVVCMFLGALLAVSEPVTAEAIADEVSLDGFTMENKAEVRQYGFVGLRFSAYVSDSVKSQYPSASYGTILIPEDMLTGELTHDTASRLDIPAEKWQNENVYTAVLAGSKQGDSYTGLPESYYNRPIVARGYVKIDGKYYYTPNTVTRSIGYVASMNVENGKGNEILNSIFEKTNYSLDYTSDASIQCSVGCDRLSPNLTLTIGGIQSNIAPTLSIEDNSKVKLENGRLVGLSEGSSTVTVSHEKLNGGVPLQLNVSVTALGHDKSYQDWTDGALTDAVTYTCECGETAVEDTSYGVHIREIAENAQRALFTNGALVNGYRLVFDGTNATLKNAVVFFNDTLATLTGAKIDFHGSYNGYNPDQAWTKDPVWDAANPLNNRYIVFGTKADLYKSAGVEAPVNAMGSDGYYIVTKGNSVFVMANTDEAYQLAAIELLDAIAGYEMYASDCVTFASNGQSISIPDMNILVRPDFEYRNRGNYLSVGTGIYGMGYTNNNIFMAVNGNFYHTALDLLDPSTYYKSHKDWFFLESQNDSFWDQLTGATRYDHYQICYSTVDDSDINTSNSPLNIMYNKVKEIVLANPTLSNLSLGPADNNYVCDCSNCKADLSTYGSNSGAYISVANKIAEKLAAELTDRTVYLTVFAYRQYKTAPTQNITVHPNVAVMVAPIEASYSVPIREQTEFADNIKAWAALTENMYFWFYQTNFDYYFYPLNSWGVMRDNISFAHENKAKYLFYQGAGDKNVSHFSKLKDYLESKLMIDSSLDYNTLVDNFFANYYGAAGDDMKEYFNALQAHMATFSNGEYKEAIAEKSYWQQAKLVEFMGYISSAYTKVESGSVYAKRIKLESIFPRYALISLYNDTSTAGSKPEFMNDCDTLGIVNFCEGKTLETELSSWRHTHSYNVESAKAEYIATNATCTTLATYYYTCSCGAMDTSRTFSAGTFADHIYTFTQGTGTDAGYDVGVCAGACGATVRVKTDYSSGTRAELVSGESVALVLPADFDGTVTGVAIGSTVLSYQDGMIDTTAVDAASHGKCNLTLSFTSSYGGAHTATVPIFLITRVISNADELRAFAADAMAANATQQYNMYGYYILAADIDCHGESIATGSGAWNSYGFMGTFDGRGHKILNMLVNNQGGIFGRIGYGATIKDVHFENTAFAANSALFGKISYKCNFVNITVDISSWVSVVGNMTYAGILGVTSNPGCSFNNFVINVANGVSVSCLLGREFTGATGSITVNLYGNANIVNYYTTDSAGANAVTSLPSDSIIRVNTETLSGTNIDTLLLTENGVGLVLTNSSFTDGSIANISIDGVAVGGATVSGGSVTVDFTGRNVGIHTVSISIGNEVWNYTNALYATQIIDTQEEMQALSTLFDGTKDYGGYYVLGADIDMNGAVLSAAEGWYFGFTGVFDGLGHSVSNFTVTTRGGIFGALKGAIVKNVSFDQVSYSYNTSTYGAALFGRTGSRNTVSGNTVSGNTVMENVSVSIASWHNGGNINGGAFFASVTENVVFTNVSLHLAENLSVTTNLLGAGFNESQIEGYIVVYFDESNTVSKWYKNSAGTEVTSLPEVSDSVTKYVVRDSRVYYPITATYYDVEAGEGTTQVTINNELFTVGDASVTVNGQTNTVAVTQNGVLTFDLAGFGITDMGSCGSAFIVTPRGDKLTYNEIWYVTQVIDTADELKALGAACKAGSVGGYYILGGNIDCAGTNMANGNSADANGFSGIFDGRGCRISNILMAYDSATQGYGGFFGRLYGCTIRNTIFDGVNIGTNCSLLGRFATKSDSSDVILENLTVNLSAYNSGEALFAGYYMYNTQFNGVTVNVANGVAVGRLLSRSWTSNGNNNGTGLTVNLGSGSSITNYYGNAAPAKPDFVTVK